jgi:hypothetical protein
MPSLPTGTITFLFTRDRGFQHVLQQLTCKFLTPISATPGRSEKLPYPGLLEPASTLVL